MCIRDSFTGGPFTTSGPALVSNNMVLSTTGAINFGSTLNSSNGTETITFLTGSDITITGVVGGSNTFSTFSVISSKINNGNNFTYSGGGSISNLRIAKVTPGPSIDTINIINITGAI